eukprot:6344795-Lingulodinium_polyedra.AAC.1
MSTRMNEDVVRYWRCGANDKDRSYGYLVGCIKRVIRARWQKKLEGDRRSGVKPLTKFPMFEDPAAAAWV